MAHALFLLLALCACRSVSGAVGLAAQDPAPGMPPRWEGMALDSRAKRLYVPCAGSVLVLDLEGKAQGRVPHLPGARTVGLAPDLGIGFTGNARANTVSIFNLETLMVEKELRTTGAGPGAVLFEPATRRIFAFNERGRNATAFDAYGGAVAGTIFLGGSPGPAVADGTGRLYASVGDAGDIEVLDARRLTVLQRWSLPQVARPVGMALDPARQRLFLLGGNALLGVLDTRSGRLLSTLALGSVVAGVICDAETGRVYVSGGEGELTVVDPGGGDTFTRGPAIAIRPGAHAMVLDQQTHLLYLPSPKQPPSPLGAPRLPGFQVQVVAPREGEAPGIPRPATS